MLFPDRAYFITILKIYSDGTIILYGKIIKIHKIY